jgi:tRNA threonylcarbamoyladenosine biosynthesis protein TsaE
VIACATDSADATRRLAAKVAGVVADGDVVVLVGDLGAGKTVFVQGFAAALGVPGPVTSPTFTLANRYEGRMIVNHLDVFRFESFDEVHDLDLPELLESGVTLIEWGDTIATMLPPDQLEVRIELGAGDDERLLRLHPAGSRWQARRGRLEAALAEWADDRTVT